MARSVFFDSQIIMNVSDGVIPWTIWQRVLKGIPGRYKYCVSFMTFLEIMNALACGDENHFKNNRKRLLVLTDVAECRFLAMPGQFIRTKLLGLPDERPEFSPEQLQRVWMPVIKRAGSKQELSSGNVVMASLPNEVNLTYGIDLRMVSEQMKYGKNLWGGELGLAKDGDKQMPSAELHAAFILHFDVHASQNEENIALVSRGLDAAYCHLSQIHHESTKGGYKVGNKLQDWIDNQQLMYLADPELTFVTADRPLIAKVRKSVDQCRVKGFTEFVEAI